MAERGRRRCFLQALEQLGVEDLANDDNEIREEGGEIEDFEEEHVEDILPDIELYEESGGSSASSSLSSDDEEDGADAGDTLQTPVATYSSRPFPQRLRRRNILTQEARTSANPSSEKEAFMLFYDIDIILQILRETNRKVRDVRRECRLPVNSVTKEFTEIELEAGIAIILRAGLDRDNFTSLESLWDACDSRPFYRVVMPLRRFKFLLRCMRFDNHRTRPQRQSNDRLAAVRDVWTIFKANLKRFYVPSDSLTVDEQLAGYRGRIPGRTFMPSKPRKYGVKFFWICEANSGFALNGIIYCDVTGQSSESQTPSGKRQRCHQCGTTSRSTCSTCDRPICAKHKSVVKREYCSEHQ